MHSPFFYPTFRHHKYFQHGFTLVELVLVIVLLAIISAVALPRFFNNNAFNERMLFDDTLNAVRYAQKTAVATGCATQFIISSNSFNLIRENSDSCVNNTTPPSFTDSLSIRHPGTNETTYTGVQSGVSLSDTSVTFFALGNASADTTITVASNKTITVVGTTGFSYDSTP